MKLSHVRTAIDRLDSQIVRLLNQRAKLSVEVADHKRRTNSPVFAPERESQLFTRLQRLGQAGPLTQPALQAIYREIISASIALQAVQTIAYMGPEGSFTHEAAKLQFGSSVRYQPVRSIADVFREVERGRADYGVVPIENSTEGVVNHTLDMFVDSEVNIAAEVSLRVRHNLLARGGRLADIRRVYIHPQTLGQCRLWLDGNLPEVELVEVSSNSKAAQLAARTPKTAAIASLLAAKFYGLDVLARSIEDQPDNITRFLVLGRQLPGPSGRDKTSILLAIKDSVGALHRILLPFARNRVNLTNIESRPSRKGLWNYMFFIDCLGHVSEPKIKRVMTQLRPLTMKLKVLGSYPRGEE